MEEMEKIMKNLEKLMAKDFDFINAGRIVIASESREVNIDMVNEICNRLKIETNHITKNELKKDNRRIELELDYLAPEIEVPKLKEKERLIKNSCIRTYKIADEKYIFRS